MQNSDRNVIYYPNKLYKIEIGQSIKDDEANKYLQEANLAIHKVLEINKTSDTIFTIDFPKNLLNKLPDEVKSKVTKELNTTDIRILTATVALAQKAKAEGKLTFMEKLDEAYFEINLKELYEYAGLSKTKHGRFDVKQKGFIRDSLINLHFKHFFILTNTDKKETMQIKQLVRIYEYEKRKGLSDRETVKLTVNGMFCNFEKTDNNTYFNLPSDINSRIRKINTGRQNPSIELFIKTIYRAKHYAKESTVSYTESKLIELLNMERYKESRHHGRIVTTLNKSFLTAKKLGILEKWNEEVDKWGNKKFIFFLY